MPRPRKCRRIGFFPDVTYFKPQGLPVRMLEEIQLSLEEIEALRLKDIEGMDQEPAADNMNVSRPTFQRVLSSARKKVADALLNGKALRIGGGNYEFAFQRFRCRNNHVWNINIKENAEDTPVHCPTCQSSGFAWNSPSGFGGRGRGRGRERHLR